MLFGENNGELEAVSVTPGTPLWSMSLGAAIGDAPSVFTYQGQSYLALLVSGADSLSGTRGDSITVLDLGSGQ